MDFHILDIIVIALVTVLGLKGLFRGMVKEVFGLLGLVGGVFIASRIADSVGGILQNFIPFLDGQSAVKLVGFAVSFLAFWSLMILIGMIIAKIVQKSGLGIVDKLAGAVVGSAKIFLIFSIVAYALGSIAFIKKRTDVIFEDSVVYPLLYDMGSYIMKFDEIEAIEDLSKLSDKASKEIEESVAETIKDEIKNGSELKDEVEKKINEAIEDLNK
jgi:membrane protein required for colicin V production